MSQISMTIESKKSIVEMRSFIEEEILTRPEAEMLLNERRWEGNTLHASGSLGSGTIEVSEGAVVVTIELSIFGIAAKGRVEEVIRSQFGRLNS